VQVTSELVRIGDVIDNAGSAAQIAIYRAPDLGTTGTLPVAQVLNTLRAHHVIGVDTRGLREISVTRLARSLDGKTIEQQIAQALERRNGLGDAANLSLTFDREPGDVRLDAGFSGAVQPAIVRYDSRNGRFDVTLEIANENGGAAAKLRFTGIAIETVEAAVLARNVERNDILKSSDVVVERRPKAEVGTDAAVRDRAVGMQARRQLRAGQAIKTADLARPDLVQRDQNVTLIYEAPGLYLTMRGKALDNGTEGDVVSVMNLQSKRTVSGTVIGRGQVSITPVSTTPPISRAPQTSDATSSPGTAQPAQIAVATVSSPVAPKAE
jgi:flagella basal body P-ring formation protein FlgA